MIALSVFQLCWPSVRRYGTLSPPNRPDQLLNCAKAGHSPSAEKTTFSRTDDCRAVLIIVEYGNIEQVLELGFDPETIRTGDILQIHAAERRADVLDNGDEGVGIHGVDLDVERIEIGEPFEQDRLAFHDWLRGQGAEIAEAKDGRPVGYDAHQIALGGVIVGGRGGVGDRAHRRGHAWGLGQAQVALRRHRLGRIDLDLARRGVSVKVQGVLVGARAAVLRGH